MRAFLIEVTEVLVVDEWIFRPFVIVGWCRVIITSLPDSAASQAASSRVSAALREEIKPNLTLVSAIPRPIFTRRLRTGQLPHSMGDVYPQKMMVDSHRGNTGDVQFAKVSHAPFTQLLEN